MDINRKKNQICPNSPLCEGGFGHDWGICLDMT